MTKEERIRSFVLMELQRTPIKTQEDCCRLAARATAHVGDMPKSDLDFIDAAAEIARGLFGAAFTNADESQRTLWIMMCEDALRHEAAMT